MLDAGRAAALVREQLDGAGSYSFAHALIQHTLYEDMGATRRAVVHRQVAEAIEQLPGPLRRDRSSELAHHWLHSGRPEDLGKALDCSRNAADAALRSLAPADALHLFRQAIDVYDAIGVSDPSTEIDLAIGMGTAQRQSGDPEFRSTLLDAAHHAARLGDIDRLVVAMLANDRGRCSKFGTIDAEKVEMLELALERLPDQAPQRALVLGALCQELTFGTTLERRLSLANEAISLAGRSGDKATKVRVLNHVSEALRVPQLLEQSLGRSSEALAEADYVGDPALQFWATVDRRIAAALPGDIEEMDRCLELSEGLARKLRQPMLTWIQTYATATRILLAGDLDKAEEMATEAFQIGTEGGEPDAAGVFSAQFASICSQRGTMGDLVPFIEQAAAENPEVPGFVAALAGAHAEGDRPDEAARLLEAFAAEGFELPVDLTWVTGMVTYAEAAIECREPKFAGPLLEQLDPWRLQLSHNDITSEGPVSHYLGGLATVLGRYEEAEDYYSFSAHMCDRIGAKGFGARTQLSWARMLLDRQSRGDTDRAHDLLTISRRTAATHGYGTTLRRADHLLGQLA